MHLSPILPGRTIPKIIHQVYRDANYPEDIAKNISNLKRLNPGWEYRFYTDRDMEKYTKSHFPTLYPYYVRINAAYGAARADFFRYLLMHREGGLYLDIKSSAEKPFDSVLRHDDIFLLSQWPNAQGESHEGWGLHEDIELAGGELQQWFIAGAAGHPFMKRVIEEVCANIDRYDPCRDGVGRKGVWKTTGPIAFSRAIIPILHEHPHRRVNAINDMGFVYSIFVDGSGEDHHHLFNKHYSKQKRFIVRNGIRKDLTMWTKYRLMRWEKRFSRLLSEIAVSRTRGHW